MTAVTEPISLGALRRETIAEFCSVIGDPNPLHLDVPLAQSLGFRDVVVPGSLLATLVLIEAEAAFGPGFDAVINSGASDYVFSSPPPAVPVTVAWGSRDRVLWPRQAKRADLEQSRNGGRSGAGGAAGVVRFCWRWRTQKNIEVMTRYCRSALVV